MRLKKEEQVWESKIGPHLNAMLLYCPIKYLPYTSSNSGSKSSCMNVSGSHTNTGVDSGDNHAVSCSS
jgi:hypothetical protein